MSHFLNCPICHQELQKTKTLQDYSICDNALSIISWYCQKFSSTSTTLNHTYQQKTSLYNNVYKECIYVPTISCQITINYIKNNTVFLYYSSAANSDSATANLANSTIELKNQIIKPDYPNIEKLCQKAKNLALFL